MHLTEKEVVVSKALPLPNEMHHRSPMRSLPLYHTKAELLLIIHIHKTHSLRIREWPQSVIILLSCAGNTKRNILVSFEHVSLSLSNGANVHMSSGKSMLGVFCIVEINQGQLSKITPFTASLMIIITGQC